MRHPALRTWLLLLVATFVMILALNFPGHLSVDSVMSLAEGRTGTRMSWSPPLHAAILGFFDRLQPGTGLYIAAVSLVLLGAWAALPALRPRIAWTGPLLLALVMATPQVAIWQGIVWKDVLFANFAVAAFVALAVAGRWWAAAPARFGFLFLSGLLLAGAALVRQNGLIVIPFAGFALAWIAARSGSRRPAIWGLAGVIAPLVLMAGLNAVTPPLAPPPPPKNPASIKKNPGLRSVQHYDLAAALAADPTRPLVIERTRPKAAAELRQIAPKIYSPVRSDTLNASVAFGQAAWSVNDAAMNAEWRSLILSDPAGYVARRLAIFQWVFAAPDIDQCLPVFVGVEGPALQLSQAGLHPRHSATDGKLYNYATWFFDTPAMSHVAFAALALVVGLLLLIRREPPDLAVAGMLAAALAFAATFAVISLACDYRYLYFLDLAAISGSLYLAIDPRLRRSRR